MDYALTKNKKIELTAAFLDYVSSEELKKYKDEGFICPECGEEVFYRNGNHKKASCFYHSKNSTECSASKNPQMSDWHKEWQQKFDEMNIEIPFRFDDASTNRADLFIYGYRVVEFQSSRISEENFTMRNKNYSKFLSLFWLFNEEDTVKDSKLVYDPNLKMYLWKKTRTCFRHFDFKEYPNVRIFFQLRENSLFQGEIIEINSIKYIDNKCYLKTSNQFSKEKFLKMICQENIPDILRISKGICKDLIYKYQQYNREHNDFFYYKCIDKDKAVKKDICEKCKYHLYDRNKHYCYKRFEDAITNLQIKGFSISQNYYLLQCSDEKGNNITKKIKIIDRTWSRTIPQCFYDLEPKDKGIQHIKVLNVITDEIYIVNVSGKYNNGWYGKKLGSKEDEKIVPDWDKSYWRLLNYK